MSTEELSELDILYLPSRWSKRLSHEIIIEDHLEYTHRESERVRKSIPCELDIAYGKRERERFDIFGTDLESGVPVFIFIHGGYWQEESITRNCYWFLAENLYKNNIKSIFLGYELCPGVTLPQLIEEVTRGLNECFEYASKSRSIYIAGHSAGGHIVASLFNEFIKNTPKETRDKIKAAFLLCGVYDLVPLVNTEINIPLKLDEQLALKMSPQFQMFTPFDTHIYVVAAEDDSPVFVEQSEKFHEKLQESGAKVSLEIMQGVDHFDIITRLSDSDFKLSKLIIDEINQSKLR